MICINWACENLGIWVEDSGSAHGILEKWTLFPGRAGLEAHGRAGPRRRPCEARKIWHFKTSRMQFYSVFCDTDHDTDTCLMWWSWLM